MFFTCRNRFLSNNLILKIFFGSALLLSTACTVQTQPTTAGDRAARAETDKGALFDGQEPIVGSITLYEAIARAVKYNSEQRVALMEQALAYDVADAATMDMLPSIAASGGFVSRSNRLVVSAESVGTKRTTLEPSYIEEKNVGTGDLQIVYNVLDFGISYVNAKQASDRKFVVEEVRRKSMQRLVHDVRTTFWKAAASQRIQKDLDALILAVQEELVRTKTDDLTKNSMPQLGEQKKLLTTLQNLMSLRKQTLTAKAELAALMNLPPNVEFSLDIPAEMDTHKVIRDFGTIDLEHFALVNRPELRIGDYEARIMEREAKKEFLRYFPGLELSAGLNYNSNSYLRSQSWADAGVRVTWNLMNIFTRPSAIQMAEDRATLERMKRVAMTMAVMSQVNVTYLKLRQSAESFEVTSTLDQVDDQIWQKTFSERLNSDKAKRDALTAASERLALHLKRDFAYAEYKDAESNLLLALGVDSLPRFSLKSTVKSLAETLEDNLSRNAPRAFKEVSYDRLPSDRGQPTALTREQREKILEWTGKGTGEEAAQATLVGEPTLLVSPFAQGVGKTNAVAAEASKIPVKKAPAKPAARKRAAVVPSVGAGELELLQVSSFEQLENAQKYWQELNAQDPAWGAYMPIFKEVDVPGYGVRFRTYITGTNENLNEICRKFEADLKSCLIYGK